MTKTLITGANKSLGYEAARRLIAAGHDVWIGARNPEAGQQAADALGARFVQIDVNDDASVAAAAAHLAEHGGLDVLVNNAGISGGTTPTEDLATETMTQVLDTNVVGIFRTTQAFRPLLEQSDSPVIVNVSSGLGSHAATSDPDRIESTFATVAYGTSKAAVNMLTAQYAKAIPTFRINCVDPGYTATDFNDHGGPQTVTEGTDAMVAMAQIGPDGPTGTYTDRHGVVAW